MKLSATSTLPASTEMVILPLVKDASLEEKLKQLGALYLLPSADVIQDFKGEFKEILVIYPNSGIKKVALVGLGTKSAFSDITAAMRMFSYQQREKMPAHITIDLVNNNTTPEKLLFYTEAIANGLLQGNYDIRLYKTNKTPFRHPFTAVEDSSVDFLVEAPQVPAALAAAERGHHFATTQLRLFDLVNAPGNQKRPQQIADWAVASAKTHGYKATIWDKKEIEKNGLHALLSVNQGSAQPPCFIILEYQPAHPTQKKLPKIGLVGKGVTFDTGGVSLKEPAGMHYMKSDMGGAAAVLGAFEVAAKIQLAAILVAAIPVTENCIDGASTMPGDVIGSYSGKTIEVIDTDAEGRLILADGLSYIAKNHQPDVLIDLATLTGSCIRTFGYACAGLFSNNDALAEKIAVAGDETGERAWRLPIWDIYAEDMQSDIADIRNLGDKPMAGATTAAKFLEAFIDNHPCWAHLDIAGVAFGTMDYGAQKCATGYGIRLLIRLIEGYAPDSNS